MRAVFRSVAGLALVASLAACGGLRHGRPARGKAKLARVAPARITTIGVNAYLWRAALDTLSFMAIGQTDSNGGVIVTEWYVNPAAPGERMKVSVTVLDQELRADALRVSTARQLREGNGWVDAAVAAGTNQKLEEVILQKARDLRRNAAG